MRREERRPALHEASNEGLSWAGASCQAGAVPATRRRQLAQWVFLVLVTLTLLATPLRSSFRWRAAFFCEVGAPIERWLAGVPNLAHFIAYGILMLLGAFVFHERPLAKAGTLVFALSAVVELEQAVFTAGHCRVRDLCPI